VVLYQVYSELIGNIATDGCSSRKYYYFIRVMGRGASHIALECALQVIYCTRTSRYKEIRR
jgi:pyrophosphate--fructose-6-phosphate 1-phosphotransferase